MEIFEKIKIYGKEYSIEILKLTLKYIALVFICKYFYKQSLKKIEEEKHEGKSPDEVYIPNSFLEKMLPFNGIHFNPNDPANLYRNPEIAYKIGKNYRSALTIFTIFFFINFIGFYR